MKTEQKIAPAVLRRGMAFLCTLVLTLMAVTLPAEAADVEGALSVPNIGLSHNGYNKGTEPSLKKLSLVNDADCSWTASGTQITGKVVPAEYYGIPSKVLPYWCCEGGAHSTMTVTNQSAETMLLTFSYTVPEHGTLHIDGQPYTSADTYSKPIKSGASISVKLTTAAKPGTSYVGTSEQKTYTAATTLSNITLEPLDPNVKVTFQPTTHGRYTAKVGNASLAIGETHSKPPETVYTLQAVPEPNFFFEGWYVGNEKISSEPTYSTYFLEDSNVSAKFIDDPLFSIIQLGEGVEGNKTNYVEVNSGYIHSATGNSHTNVGDTSLNNDYGPSTKFPNSRWSVQNGTIQTSEKGTATGDSQTALGYSQARASLYSDIIRVKCLENCIISFDSSMAAKSVKIKNSGSNDDEYGIFLYCYTTSSASANAGTIKANGTAVIKGSQQTSASASGTQVVVNKGEYLYLYAYAWTRLDTIFSALNKGYTTDNYEYNATISHVTVTPNNETFQFTTKNTDNMDTALAQGSVIINGVHQKVTQPYTAEMAKGATLTLKPGTAPAGYTFIGWHNVTSKTYDYTHDTYTVPMTQDWEVNPIYVPAMTITAGGDNGYGSADYQYKSLSGQMVPPNGQYVARGPIPSNGENPAFYTSLKDAFAAKDNTVFLLAGDTINGDLTIPAGKTLVIPDRFADPGPNLSTGLPEQYDTSAGISSYCKVNYSGNLTVEGTLVVNARQSGAAGGVCGRATGGIGYLSLDGSTVTVKSGGSLFGYGLIRGGSISAESNSTVRELMEISDMRSALVMEQIYNGRKEKKVFPFSNFSIKTIESPVTYASDAKLFAQYSVTLEGNNKSQGAAPLIAASGALFNLTKGSMTKYFDPATYKTVYRVNENSTMDTGFFELTVHFGVSGQGSTDLQINTKEYWMPLNAGFDLRTAGDMTVNGDFKFLPGASLSVEKGGKCTVANGKSLLFYRLNDYDTRGIGNKVYQKGYSSKLYPVNATKLPDGPEPTKDLAKIGSARLNVDGEMIVNGGLYVSDELVSQSNQGFTAKEPVDGTPKSRQEINAAYFKVYDNGYNVLTGTGAIDMTAVQAKQPEVYEAMTSTNTNDPAWAPIPISPIKGLPENAEADTQDKYQPLNKATTYYGVYRPGNFYVWTTEKPEIAKIVGGGNETTTYSSLANAVQAYTGTGYIQMLKDSTEPGFTVSKNVTLDLNGKTVKLASPLTVAADYTLSGMDNSTAGEDYVTAPSGKIVGTVTGTVAPTYQTPTVNEEYDRYVAIPGTEADGNTPNLSFHHFNISVTGYHFELATGDTPQCALFFIGKFRGDDAAKKYLTKLGFTLKYIADESQDFSYPMPGSLNNEVGLDEEGAYLFEAYLMRSFDKNDAAAYQTKISATAQAIFGTNVGTQNSETKEWSFEDAWQNALTDSDMDISPAEKEILEKFLKDLNIPIPNPKTE